MPYVKSGEWFILQIDSKKSFFLIELLSGLLYNDMTGPFLLLRGILMLKSV